MFKKSYNRAVLRFQIKTITPLLIRAGDTGLDPALADLSCVRTHHARHGTTVYIPGSSLKGVLRSAAEASMRGQPIKGAKASCDNPLDDDKGCGNRLVKAKKDGMPPQDIHKNHCLTCRFFGSSAIKGRFSARDLFPWSDHPDKTAIDTENRQRANQVEARHGVSIDRIMGSVKHGPFDQELVPAGVQFWGDMALENYQVWQLGLLAKAFSELNDGFAQLGSSKSRGLGVVTLAIDSILHEQTGLHHGNPVDVADIASKKEVEDYGLLRAGKLPDRTGQPYGLATRFTIHEDQVIEAWLKAGLDALGGLR